MSRGVPMLLGGDEFRRTQGGNNNAYCQDNDISWFDWTLADKNAGLVRFFSQMIALRKSHRSFRSPDFYDGRVNERGRPDIAWHGCQLDAPGWTDPNARCLAFTLGGFDGDPDVHVMLNSCGEAYDFEIPTADGTQWARLIDTFLPSPDDIVESDAAVAVDGATYNVQAHSVVALISRKAKR